MKTICYLADVSCYEDDALFKAHYSLATSQRQSKIDHLVRKKDKWLSLGAFMLLRHGLFQLGYYEDMEFSFGEDGKPYIQGAPCSFSFSHAGSKVFVCLSQYSLGCDIEEDKRGDIRIAEHFFHEEEINAIHASGNPNKTFARLWTLKESYLKYLGTGLKRPLSSFCVELEPNPHLKNNAEPFFQEFDLLDGYSLSLCYTKGEVLSPEVILLSKIS